VMDQVVTIFFFHNPNVPVRIKLFQFRRALRPEDRTRTTHPFNGKMVDQPISYMRWKVGKCIVMFKPRAFSNIKDHIQSRGTCSFDGFSALYSAGTMRYDVWSVQVTVYESGRNVDANSLLKWGASSSLRILYCPFIYDLKTLSPTVVNVSS
jgi:hypothetical protein